MAKKILITGASGLIGTRLTALLIERGHGVAHLGRAKKEDTIATFFWDPAQGKIDASCLAQIDAIVHLAGASVAGGRWSARRKTEIEASRIQSTRLLMETLKNNSHTVRAVVCASAIGYYGLDDDKIFVESDAPGHDFLAEVTRRWEIEADTLTSPGIRTSKIRIGIVLSEKGGALTEMAKPIRWGVGSPLGSGKQFLSWIHIDDLCQVFVKAIEDDLMKGTYNATAAWCSNEEMTRAIARVLGKPLWLPAVPSVILKIILGEMAGIVLKGTRVSGEKIRSSGFQFEFNDLDRALKNLIAKY